MKVFRSEVYGLPRELKSFLKVKLFFDILSLFFMPLVPKTNLLHLHYTDVEAEIPN